MQTVLVMQKRSPYTVNRSSITGFTVVRDDCHLVGNRTTENPHPDSQKVATVT